jgi:hypothetical protein
MNGSQFADLDQALAYIRSRTEAQMDEARSFAKVMHEALDLYLAAEQQRVLASIVQGMGNPDDQGGLAFLGEVILGHTPLANEICRQLGMAPPRVSAVPADEPLPADLANGHLKGAWPHLARGSMTLPLVIFGGVPVPEKIRWAKNALGGMVDWVPAPKGTPRGLAERIANGRVLALVLCHDLTDHGQAGILLEACRKGNVPHSMSGTAGYGALRQAFDAIEKKLGEGDHG